MESIQAALKLLLIAYPAVFIVMALFSVLTYGLMKIFPGKE